MRCRSVEVLTRCLSPLVHDLNPRYKQGPKLGTAWRVTGTMFNVTPGKRDLIAGNAFLRRQIWYIVLGERHRRRLVREYANYFHHARPHQGIDRLPDPLTACDRGRSQADQRVNAVPIRGGLHHDYRWAA